VRASIPHQPSHRGGDEDGGRQSLKQRCIGGSTAVQYESMPATEKPIVASSRLPAEPCCNPAETCSSEAWRRSMPAAVWFRQAAARYQSQRTFWGEICTGPLLVWPKCLKPSRGSQSYEAHTSVHMAQPPYLSEPPNPRANSTQAASVNRADPAAMRSCAAVPRSAKAWPRPIILCDPGSNAAGMYALLQYDAAVSRLLKSTVEFVEFFVLEFCECLCGGRWRSRG